VNKKIIPSPFSVLKSLLFLGSKLRFLGSKLFVCYDRYLLDAKWFSRWKTYVGFDDWSSGSIGDESANPGPVDNSFIIEGMI